MDDLYLTPLYLLPLFAGVQSRVESRTYSLNCTAGVLRNQVWSKHLQLTSSHGGYDHGG